MPRGASSFLSAIPRCRAARPAIRRHLMGTPRRMPAELSVGDPPVPSRPAGDQAASDGNAAPDAGKRPGLVVSSPALDAWPAPLPEGDAEAVIRLPSPPRVEIDYDIEGGEDEATVFLQSVMHEVEAW